jgi:hypothetical protein
VDKRENKGREVLKTGKRSFWSNPHKIGQTDFSYPICSVGSIPFQVVSPFPSAALEGVLSKLKEQDGLRDSSSCCRLSCLDKRICP